MTHSSRISKLDVEGAELLVLRDTGALLDRWLPILSLKVLEPFQTELYAFFAAKPYRKFLITDEGFQDAETIRAHDQFRDII